MTVRPGEELGYRRPISTWWWTRRRTYFVFVMRELSSIFIAWFVVFLLILLRALTHGAAAYDDFLDWAASPWVLAINVVASVFLLLHVVTWFSLTPQAMDVRMQGRPVPAVAIIGAQYAALVVVSAVVIWLVAS